MRAVTLIELLDWWAGDLLGAEQDKIEEAIFTDDRVAADAEWIASLAQTIASAVEGGALVAACLTRTLSRQLEDAGVAHTTYVAHPGDIVACAATPDQRFSILHLRGDFQGADLVQVRISSPDFGEYVLEDVPVDSISDEVILLQAGDTIRALPTTQLVLEVSGRRGDQAVAIGTYVLEHRAIGDAHP